MACFLHCHRLVTNLPLRLTTLCSFAPSLTSYPEIVHWLRISRDTMYFKADSSDRQWRQGARKEREEPPWIPHYSFKWGADVVLHFSIPINWEWNIYGDESGGMSIEVRGEEDKSGESVPRKKVEIGRAFIEIFLNLQFWIFVII